MKLAPTLLLFGQTVRRIHAVGVGGMGLGPLAIYLAKRGWQVSGEDSGLTPAVGKQLERAGVTLLPTGMLPDDADLVVVSTAVPVEHPTRQAARTRSIKVVRRGEVLAEVSRDHRLVAICGSHGKTTTTAMLVTALKGLGCEPGFVLGGLWVNDDCAPADVGAGDWLVAEIDESDGTIERFSPAITVMVNLDWDHADHYAREEAMLATFSGLLARTTEAALGWDGCANTNRVFAGADSSLACHTFGRSGTFALRECSTQNASLSLELGGAFPAIKVGVAARGEFNAFNATAALAAAQLMGETPTMHCLADYRGVRRRQAVLLARADLTVMEDYAHHPAEIRALLGSLRRELAEGGRLVVVFQPHRFSRTRQFKNEFAAALAMADSLHLLDVYGAGESPLSG